MPSPLCSGYVSIESRIPKSHPLRAIKARVDEILGALSPEFDKVYSSTGRPSIAPECLLKAPLKHVLFIIRSERQLMDQLDYNLLFRWFEGLGMDDEVWAPTTFSKNRERFIDGEIADKCFKAVVRMAHKRKLISRERFSVDGRHCRKAVSPPMCRQRRTIVAPGSHQMLLAEQTTGEGSSHSELPLLVFRGLHERYRAWRLRQYPMMSANLRDFRSRENHPSSIAQTRTIENRHRFINLWGEFWVYSFLAD